MDPEKLAVLLVCARESSQEAERALANHFSRLIELLVRGRLDPGLCSRLDPEEIPQEVLADFFTKVLNSQSCPAAAALPAYLLRAAINKALDANREFRDTAKRAIGRECTMPVEVVQQGPSPVDAFEFHDELEHDLQRLPERERQTVTMLLGGASREMAADKLRVTVRTVGNIVKRLRKQHAFAALDGPDEADRGRR